MIALGCTKLSDAGAKEIGKLDKLTALDLGCTELSNAGAKEIGKLILQGTFGPEFIALRNGLYVYEARILPSFTVANNS